MESELDLVIAMNNLEAERNEHGPGSRCPIEFCEQCKAEDNKLEPKDDV